MKRFNKKITAIVGTATLAIGLMALPALAGTTQQGNSLYSQMQSFMQNSFSPGQHQTLMNSKAMQNLHNSAEMQNVMQTGDVKKMQELMNSDPNVKAQIGQDNLDKMNQFMSKSGGNMMTGGSGNTNSGSLMMNNGGNSTANINRNMMGSDSTMSLKSNY